MKIVPTNKYIIIKPLFKKGVKYSGEDDNGHNSTFGKVIAISGHIGHDLQVGDIACYTHFLQKQINFSDCDFRAWQLGLEGDDVYWIAPGSFGHHTGIYGAIRGLDIETENDIQTMELNKMDNIILFNDYMLLTPIVDRESTDKTRYLYQKDLQYKLDLDPDFRKLDREKRRLIFNQNDKSNSILSLKPQGMVAHTGNSEWNINDSLVLMNGADLMVKLFNRPFYIISNSEDVIAVIE